jgi:hydrogenase nickel incorporation protein HypA/HybF
MHELAISEALLGQLTGLAEQHGWPRLSRVWVRIGLLSGVVPEALQFAFNALSAGTPAEGAELVLETAPGRFACDQCGELDLERLTFVCPQCDGPLRLLRASRELSLGGVEVVTP